MTVVKIVKSSGSMWYKDKIGETFEVRSTQPEDTDIGKAYQLFDKSSYYIKEEDCIKLTNQN